MASRFMLPTRSRSGAELMLEPEVQEIIDALHNGYAPFGWAGDERLGLYRRSDHRWELVRVEESGLETVVCRSRPGLDLNMGLILHLVKHDSRRGKNSQAMIEQVIRENESLQQAQTDAAVDALRDPMEKVYWNLGKANQMGRPFVSLAGLSDKLPTR